MASYKRRFNGMKDEWFEAQAIRRRAIRDLIFKTVDKHRIAFLKWYEYCRTLRNVDACKRTLGFLDVMKDGLAMNTSRLLLTSKFAILRD